MNKIRKSEMNKIGVKNSLKMKQNRLKNSLKINKIGVKLKMNKTG